MTEGFDQNRTTDSLLKKCPNSTRYFNRPCLFLITQKKMFDLFAAPRSHNGESLSLGFLHEKVSCAGRLVCSKQTPALRFQSNERRYTLL